MSALMQGWLKKAWKKIGELGGRVQSQASEMRMFASGVETAEKERGVNRVLQEEIERAVSP